MSTRRPLSSVTPLLRSGRRKKRSVLVWRKLTRRLRTSCIPLAQASRNAATSLVADGLVVGLAGGLAGWLTGGNLWAMGLAAPVVIAGHIWPVQMGFRGGEGFAAALGALAVLDLRLIAAICVLALVLYLVSHRRAVAGVVCLLVVWPLALYRGWPAGHLTGLGSVVFVMFWAFRRHVRSLFRR